MCYYEKLSTVQPTICHFFHDRAAVEWRKQYKSIHCNSLNVPLGRWIVTKLEFKRSCLCDEWESHLVKAPGLLIRSRGSLAHFSKLWLIAFLYRKVCSPVGNPVQEREPSLLSYYRKRCLHMGWQDSSSQPERVVVLPGTSHRKFIGYRLLQQDFIVHAHSIQVKLTV
jgi:hypothetical protein